MNATPTATQIVSTEEINALPTVAQPLATMRDAKATRDRVRADRRSSDRRIDAAEQVYASAAEEYRVAFDRERDRLYAERSPLA